MRAARASSPCRSNNKRCGTRWAHEHCPVCSGPMAAPTRLPDGRRFQLERCASCEGLLLRLLEMANPPLVKTVQQWHRAQDWLGSIADELDAVDAGGLAGVLLRNEGVLEAAVARMRNADGV